MHKQWPALLLAVMVLLMSSVATPLARAGNTLASPAFNPPPTGTDFYYPGDCPRWTWLGADCYPSAQQALQHDVQWIAQQNLGHFQRVWIMLDQGIHWNTDGTYGGLDAAYLANLDDALARFAIQHIVVDAVLLEASAGSNDQNQFQSAALDGAHPTLRAGYLQTLKDFAAHVAANATDAATIAVVDSFNEAYFQLGRFGVPDQAIHAFLHDAYGALKGGDPSLVVTASDTTRLLKDTATWEPLYADSTDVYDIHGYSDAPWGDAALWARAQGLTKPWFSGEVGCAPGHVSCTYDGNTPCTAPSACALSVDSWWLHNLPADGARAVLIEDAGTAWTSGDALTAVGRMLQAIVGQAAG